jgi:flavin-dependent dehydrogenase
VLESFENVIIGGGLAGLIAANLLAKNQKEVLLIEKKVYPFHRVCGEYVSNEVKDFLLREGLFPQVQECPQIDRFTFSDTKGRSITVPLGLGGFGLSRYLLDDFLVKRATENGAIIKVGIQVEEIEFIDDQFQLELSDGSQLQAKNVIGAFGKRSKLDKALARNFIQKRSPYIGVKYHINADIDRKAVALHNFSGGYCGINAIEEGKANLCYLGSRDQLRTYGSIPEMEEAILWKNPQLKHLFSTSEFLFEKPEVINEINFESKNPVENHILMAGDAAGLITPLCGNGMAMAIQAGKIAAESILSQTSRIAIEQAYEKGWRKNFENRLKLGRNVQRLFGTNYASTFTRNLIQYVPFVANKIIKNTHGKSF